MSTWQHRVMELGVGLALVGLTIIIAKVWVGQKNATRADSEVFRRSVAITLSAVDQYTVLNATGADDLTVWQTFLGSPRGQRLPVSPAHTFVDSFVVRYRDGYLDSLETTQLARQLTTFSPR